MDECVRLMLIDDHPLVRRGLAELISDHDHLIVCGQASSAEEAIPLPRRFADQPLVMVHVELYLKSKPKRVLHDLIDPPPEIATERIRRR